MGDFNEWYSGPVSASLWRGLASRAPAAPRTHPAFYPLFALDRLYCDAELAPGEMRAHRTERSRVASDHLPVVVTVTVGEEAGARKAS
jgi:endonuclease/exonuclease/phosphatase family metal-dependent hydrolase